MKTYSILLVEDCLDFTCVINRFLSKSQYYFKTKNTETLEEAYDLLSLEVFDLIILDLNLSDSFGIKSLEEIHKLCPHTAIVVLTGADENELGLKSIQLGAQDFIKKDNLNEHNLKRIIKYAVERQRLKNIETRNGDIKNFYKSLKNIESYVSNSNFQKEIDETYKKFIKFDAYDANYRQKNNANKQNTNSNDLRN